MNSYSYRNDPMFLRNQFETHGKFEFPYIRKQAFDFDHIQLIALTETKNNDSPENCRKIVHGFLDDYRINRYYNYPERYRAMLTQYRALISPDYSTWQEMNTWRGLEGNFTQPLGSQVLAGGVGDASFASAVSAIY